jgi:hypothetical protein
VISDSGDGLFREGDSCTLTKVGCSRPQRVCTSARVAMRKITAGMILITLALQAAASEIVGRRHFRLYRKQNRLREYMRLSDLHPRCVGAARA